MSLPDMMEWAKEHPDRAAVRIAELEQENAALLADKERLDWLDRNLTPSACFQTFGREFFVGELRQYVDAAIQKEAQP